MIYFGSFAFTVQYDILASGMWWRTKAFQIKLLYLYLSQWAVDDDDNDK